MPFWDRPKARVFAPLSEVVVRAEHLLGEEPRYLTMDVQEFALCMIQTAHYPRDALPRELRVSAAVDYYICAVENGGHAGFVENSGWDEALRGDIAEGLSRLGFDPLLAIFRELEAYPRDSPERFEAIGWDDPTARALDDRFNALARQELFERHADWIRSWPNLQIVPSAQYGKVVPALVDRNAQKRRRWWQ